MREDWIDVGLLRAAKNGNAKNVGSALSRGATTNVTDEAGSTPLMLTRPNVGLHPAIPQKEAGRVIDPPVCEPIAPKHIPQATAAAEPLDDPPGVCALFQGFAVWAGSRQANCVVTVFPKMTAPADFSFRTSVASGLADSRARN